MDLRFLKEENLLLKAQLAALSGNKPNVTSGTNPETPRTTAKPTWAKIAQQHPHASQRPLSPRKQAADARVFQPVQGPQGFEYVYITRSRRINRPEIRRRLNASVLTPPAFLTFPCQQRTPLAFFFMYNTWKK